MLPPSAIAGVSVVCAAGTWFSAEPVVLRGLAVGAAAAAVVGSVVMRSWDRLAGRQVADLVRARESDGWTHEERVAELEADLDESRELRQKLERKLRSKRAELAGLRNEHAALLRRYATAETERASALEGRRLLAIEAVPGAADDAAGGRPGPESEVRPEPAPEPVPELTPEERLPAVRRSAEAARARGTTPPASLFLRANAALELLARRAAPPTPQGPQPTPPRGRTAPAGPHGPGAPGPRRPGAPGAQGAHRVPEQAQRQPRTPAPGPAQRAERPAGPQDGQGLARVRTAARPTPAGAARIASVRTLGAPGTAQADVASAGDGPERAGAAQAASAREGASREEAARAAGQVAPADAPGAGEGHERAGETQQAGPCAVPAAAAAVVVAPAAPMRPALAGGFDFFGNKAAAVAEPSALDAVHNTDLADVVGDEALALHKAEEEATFRPAGAAERGVGQIIDLTAHDETERLDVTDLRGAVS
ncbi:hypothetical protein GCM10018793_53480 [Streptomyces sulfonofaciens]|uniref:Secreted protein n=1 Tax=Streptomyces sulfonofaciens TaxID=68272 RepID=A0A919GK09_9ACTN|nr:hypothetical protein GCM10018793_53480 [Streptomyces sulfonofaciens]